MLEPNATFQNAIKQNNVKVCEIYDVALTNGNTFYYTTHSKEIVWGSPSRVYFPVPIVREAINKNINLEMNTVQITIDNIIGDLFDQVEKNVLDGVTITIKRILWTDSGSYSSDLELVLFIGTADVEFDRKILVLTCKSILNSLNVQIPRALYQEPCNHTLFDEGCDLTQSDYEVDGETTSAGGNRFSVIDSDAQIFKVAFSGGDTTSQFSVGDAMTGGVAGVGVCIHKNYLTSTTGIIWIGEVSAQFASAEVVSGPAGVSDIILSATPHEDTILYQMGEMKLTSGDKVVAITCFD